MLDLIFDRTQSDVARVEYLRAQLKAGTATAAERAEYLSAPKGAYCAADLNRVGAAINTVAAALTTAGYNSGPAMRTDWADSDEFLAADMTAYLQAVESLRSALAVLPETPETPADVTGWQQANDVERIVEDVYQLLLNMAAAYFYLGDLYLGEV